MNDVNVVATTTTNASRIPLHDQEENKEKKTSKDSQRAYIHTFLIATKFFSTRPDRQTQKTLYDFFSQELFCLLVSHPLIIIFLSYTKKSLVQIIIHQHAVYHRGFLYSLQISADL